MSAFEGLGIDINSLALYFVNFGLIVFLIGKFLSGPIISILEKRTATIKNNLSEADKLKEEMLLQKSQMESEHAKMREEMNEEIRLLKLDLDTRRKQSEKEVEEKKVQMMDELNKSMAEQKASLKNELKKDIIATIQKMVSHIVSNKIPEEVLQESVEEAWTEFRK